MGGPEGMYFLRLFDEGRAGVLQSGKVSETIVVLLQENLFDTMICVKQMDSPLFF